MKQLNKNIALQEQFEKEIKGLLYYISFTMGLILVFIIVFISMSFSLTWIIIK